MKSILSIDFGRKNIGFAISDLKGISIQPLPTLKFQKKMFWQNLTDLIMKHTPLKIVLGFPNSILNQEIFDFKRHLEKIISPNITVHLINEDYSTQEAKQIQSLLYSNKKIKKEKNLDSIAASVLLKRFFTSSDENIL